MRLYLRASVWWVRYSFEGKRPHYSLRVSTEAEAKEELERIKYEIKHGTHRPSKRVIFDNLIKEYLQWARKKKADTSYQRDLTSVKGLLKKFSGTRIDRMTLRQGEQYQNQRLDGLIRISKKPKLENATVNRETRLLIHMFNKAVEWDYLSQNPLRKLKLLKEPRRIRYVTAEEWPLLLSACSPGIRSIVIFARHTGMRRSEIFNCQWTDIDWKKNHLIVRKCKNNTPRTIPLSGILQKMLTNLHKRATSCYLFPGKGGTRRTTLKTAFKAACRRADIKNLRFHDLRHTFASDLVNAGVDLATVMNLMGHKTIQTTMRYAHLYDKHLREAIERGSDLFNAGGPNLAQEEDGSW